MAGILQRRAEYAARPDTVWDVLRDGSRRAREVAGATMEDVRQAMKLRYPIA
jgi:tryptophanyl-tRNA synthetase